MELNLILLGTSFTSKAFGYDRIRVGDDANFGDGNNEPGIDGWLKNGVKFLPSDLVDTALTAQGIPNAQGISLVAACRGQINKSCLGDGYQGTFFGHSLGAADVSVLKGMGLINKSVGLTVFSLPPIQLTPGGMSVRQGSHDIVNLWQIGSWINRGSVLVQQHMIDTYNALHYHYCDFGYQDAGCRGF